MEESFSKIVMHIFTNWSALKLAVDHSMGGSDSKQVALDFINYMTQYCMYENNVDVDKIQETLEDILDEEFETICEDGSTKEVASVLYKFLLLLKQGDVEQCETEYQKLPVMSSTWLNNSVPVQQTIIMDSSSDDEAVSSTPMEADSWTQVKSRRKK